jgi:hypothetical protein
MIARLFLTAAALAAAAPPSALACGGDESEVCLIQLKKESASKLFGDVEGNSPLDFLAGQIAALRGNGGDHGNLEECPGQPLIANADSGVCTHGSIEVRVDFDDEDIEEYFGDNVLMKNWKYYIEGCKEAECQLIDPDVNHHTFHVGKTEIRIEGYDLAGNFNKCIRTVYVLDKEEPVFVEEDTVPDQNFEMHFPPERCAISGGAAFSEYEEQTGFTGDVVDNCDEEVEVVRKIFTLDGEEIFQGPHDEEGLSYPELVGPGDWVICYVATDDYSQHVTSAMPFDSDAPHNAKALKFGRHCAQVRVSDRTPPYGIENCPGGEDRTMLVIVEAHETEAHDVTWTPPTASGDNCEAFGEIPAAEEQSQPPKYPGMTLPVGSHPVNYALMDAFGNVIEDEECSFTIEVKPRAHPVVLTCPPNVTFETLPDASFAIVTWEDPVATQGDKILDQSHISYPQNVSLGLPFPFGKTTVIVHAAGEITGERHDEHLQFDECTFSVTVKDPQRPDVDGRLFRCKESNVTNQLAPPAKPYRVCGGLDLLWEPHPQYVHTHGYDVAGVKETSLECCTDEFSIEHECVPVETDVAVTPQASYCKPKAQ